jgi:cell division protein FtsB
LGAAEIIQLAPLGGATVLLIVLLRMVMAERALWSTERKAMIKEHQHDLDQQAADLLKMNDRLRARVTDLERQVDEARARERAREKPLS